jgi:hypothetical protein
MAELDKEQFTQARIIATKVAARVQQRANRKNPDKDFYAVAVPIIEAGILEGRADLLAKASDQIKSMARQIVTLQRIANGSPGGDHGY